MTTPTTLKAAGAAQTPEELAAHEPQFEAASTEKCRYCGGDGEHYQGPSKYTECEPCQGTGRKAVSPTTDARAEANAVIGQRITGVTPPLFSADPTNIQY